jgi:Holliday junction DNA helicase RuvB
MGNRIASMHGAATVSEQPSMNAARPDSLHQFIGQTRLVSIVRTSVSAAHKLNGPFPHSLVGGAPGLGKTTLAALIAQEMGVRFLPVSPDNLTDANSVRRALAELDDSGYDKRGEIAGRIAPSVVFLDEAHRLSRQAQEVLYSAIEDRVVESALKNPITGILEVRREWVPCFSLIAATNRPCDLTTPFKDRLRLHLHLEPYTAEEGAIIARQTLARLGLRNGEKSAEMIAARGRNVPRRIIGICEYVRDVCVARDTGLASPAVCEEAFLALGLDPLGLGRQETKYLKYLALTQKAVGIHTLAALLGEESRSVEESIEPFLIEKGFIEKSSRGRVISAAGKEYVRQNHGAAV